MTRHRFVNAGITPIPMGATAEYACICGRRGTHAAITRHIAESSIAEESAIVEDDGDFGGETKANYLPVEPRGPAPAYSDDDDPVLPPPPPATNSGDDTTTLPPPFATKKGGDTPVRTIAELFQDMLRTAFQAGVDAAKSGEAFEIWYQREVLQ